MWIDTEGTDMLKCFLVIVEPHDLEKLLEARQSYGISSLLEESREGPKLRIVKESCGQI